MGLWQQQRVRTPTCLQMEAVECGAAALAMVLGYHGRVVSVEELRVACGVSRDGTKASNILKAARQYGLKCKGFSKEPRQLAALPLPAILFWNFNHFVVLEGFGQGRVYLNDPAIGPRTVSAAEFDEGFTGVVLVFERGPEFQRGGARRGLLRPLARRLAGAHGGLGFVLLASLALAVPGILAPVFTRVFVDYYLVAQMPGWLRPLLLGMVVAAVLRAALTWLQQLALLRLETRLALTTSYRFFRHVLRLPMEFFTQRYGGEIGGRVEINDRIAQLLSGELATALLNIFTAAFFIALMLYYDPLLTVVGLGIAGLNVLALRFVARRRRDGYQRLIQEQGKLLGTSLAGLQTVETLKATGSESDFFARWAGHLATVLTAEQALGLSTLLLASVPPFLTALNTVAILGVGALRVMDGHLTIGLLVAFQSLMASLMTPVNQLVTLGGTLQEVEGELSRLDDVLRYEPDPELVSGGLVSGEWVSGEWLGASSPTTHHSPDHHSPLTTDTKLAGHLELRGVTFGYSRLQAPLIEDFTLTRRPGARVAVVGLSASGKSTVAKLVSGLYKPWQGEVLLDGRPRAHVHRAVLANSLALVDQDFFLVEGTVRELLTLWDETVPEEQVVQAAKDACIHEDIAARAGGYDSRVEEAGSNFSGGQRQRLEIARALVANPTLLVLDEATSALDPLTEKTIDDNLRRRGCTCLIIAHRLSTIRDCDEIIVLDKGRVVQRGTHEALAAVEGLYRQLIAEA
jgi:NHLM bacteriocin system ABC transporter peptidase/ATP-binding protein